MDFEKFIEDFESEKIDSSYENLYEFALLKVVRHDLSNLIEKNNFDDDVEADLKNALRKLNAIHTNKSYLENEFNKIKR